MQKLKWSYSGLKDFINCPRQYHEVKVLKRFNKVPTKQTLYGNVVHRALEDYVKDGTPLERNYERFKPMLDIFREMDGEKYPEHHMAVRYDLTPCSFGAKDYWARGIADLLVVDESDGFIVDYKTGSNRYADPKQLQLMALMAFAHFPELEYIKAGLLFVAHNDFVTCEFQRENLKELWEDFHPPLKRLSLCMETGVWQENPTPLCGWCPVSTCDHYKDK